MKRSHSLIRSECLCLSVSELRPFTFRVILESWALIPATSIDFLFGVSQSSPV